LDQLTEFEFAQLCWFQHYEPQGQYRADLRQGLAAMRVAGAIAGGQQSIQDYILPLHWPALDADAGGY
jgi:hypothetical protein